MKKILLVVLSISLLIGASMVSAANLKVGVVDVQKVLQDIPQVKAMQDKLKEQFKPQDEKITAARKQFSADLAKYNKNQAVMKEGDKKAAQKKLTDEQNKLRTLQVSFQQQVVAAQRSSMQAVFEDVEDAINSIAKDQNLDLVLVKASVAYSNPDMDITEKVIDKLK